MKRGYKEINNFIDKEAADFEAAMLTSGDFAFRLAKSQIDKMDTVIEAGQTVPHVAQTQKNKNIINGISLRLANSFSTQAFKNRVGRIGEVLEIIQEDTVIYYEDQFGDISNEAIRKSDGIVSLAEQNFQGATTESSLYDNVFSPAIDGMYKDLYAGVTISQFSKNAEVKVQRRLKSVLSPLYTSLIQSASANINALFGADFKLVWVAYVRNSNTPKERRTFCDHYESGLDGNVFYYHIDEVLTEWSSFEGGAWGGSYPSTNNNNILENRGGFNCKHSFDYYKASQVSDKSKIRAKQKGYI